MIKKNTTVELHTRQLELHRSVTKFSSHFRKWNMFCIKYGHLNANTCIYWINTLIWFQMLCLNWATSARQPGKATVLLFSFFFFLRGSGRFVMYSYIHHSSLRRNACIQLFKTNLKEKPQTSAQSIMSYNGRPKYTWKWAKGKQL